MIELHPRMEILRKIDDIKDNRCEACEEISKVNANIRNTYCRDNCDYGKELVDLGEQLTELTNQKRANKTKSHWADLKPMLEKKPKEKIIIKSVEEKPQPIKWYADKPKRSESIMELTKETFLKLSGEGKTNKQIMQMYGMNNVTFYKLKNDWGLVNKKFSKSISKVKSSPSVEEKTEKDNVKDIKVEPKKAPVAQTTTEAQSCDCKQLHDQIVTLQSELEQQKNDLQKYKTLYFSTVEALKVHLP